MDLLIDPTQRDRPPAQVVLAQRRFGVVQYLFEGGLADIKQRGLGQVLAGPLRRRGVGEHQSGPPWASAPRRWERGEAGVVPASATAARTSTSSAANAVGSGVWVGARDVA